MKLYVVIVNDRHVDPTPFVFDDRQAAIDAARARFEESWNPADVGDDELGEDDQPGWLYYAKWSHEDGDDIWVIERELDAEIDV